MAAVLVFVFTRAATTSRTTSAGTPPRTATATAVHHRGRPERHRCSRARPGSTAVGLMRLFQANDGTVRFAIAAQGVAAERGRRDATRCGSARTAAGALLGDVKDPVGEDGRAHLRRARATTTSTSSRTGSQTYDSGRWSRSTTKDAKEPGKVILSGDLPHRRRRRLIHQELAGVHDPGRVAAVLHRAQQLQPELADLVGQVGRVVAADRVVVGDRAARGRRSRGTPRP